MGDVKEKLALGVFISSIALIVLLLFLVSFRQGITGGVIEDLKEEQKIAEFSCEDSDNGRNYSVKGSVKYCNDNGCSSEQDSCSGDNLIEWFCLDNNRDYEKVLCNFECDDGVCVDKVIKYKTSAGGVGGGGSSSSSSSSGGGTTTTQTQGQIYELGELTSEQTLEVMKYDDIKFSINFNAYTLDVSDNTETLVSFSFSSQSIGISVGEETAIDLNSDSNQDIYIKVKSINLVTSKITLKIRNY